MIGLGKGGPYFTLFLSAAQHTTGNSGGGGFTLAPPGITRIFLFCKPRTQSEQVSKMFLEKCC